ncbi:hypothetical protein ACQ9ZF_05175 [Cetobacterium somerae]|uniref:hypothetical protein n=1 Tax=Cetobacterium somerae TaxID=188913 RepID=UPI003D766E37
MEFRIDETKRQVIVITGVAKATEIVVNELDLLNRKFLEGTHEEYECELVLQDVEIVDESGEKTGVTELKAFARRKNVDNWIMEFIPDEYIWG